MNNQRTICIPVNDSKESMNAINWVIKELIDTRNDQVVLLNVRPIAFNEFGINDELPVLLHNDAIYKAEMTFKNYSNTLLNKYAQMLHKHGIEVQVESLRGEPRVELESAIKLLQPDIVIMGSGKKSAFSRIVLGSTSKHLLQCLHIPVIIVPLRRDNKCP